MHYHFVYDHSQHAIDEGGFHKYEMNCNRMNFPYKSFYNPEDDVVYCFYRQGQAFTIEASNPANFKVEKMTDKDLGQMYLFNNKALIARSSSTVLFFKIMADEDDPEDKKWTQYEMLNIRGFIYFIKGNVRIQITTDDNIYFYLIDLETFVPKLENVMFNFMGCNQMMFGSRVKYGITYKTNQKSFDVYRRRFIHDYKVPISHEILEGSMGLDLPSMNAFLVTNIDKIYVHDSETYQRIGEMPITLLKTETREPNQIIALRKSNDDRYIACISGKNLIMKQQKPNQLFIFKRRPAQGDETKDQFEQVHRLRVKDIPIFNKVSVQFYFKALPPGQSEYTTLIFVKQDRILELDFTKPENECVETIYNFQMPLNR